VNHGYGEDRPNPGPNEARSYAAVIGARHGDVGHLHGLPGDGRPSNRAVPYNAFLEECLRALVASGMSLRSEFTDRGGSAINACALRRPLPHLGLGKLYRRTGKREQAREPLTTATTMYREMGLTYWLEQAQAEIGELGDRARWP
jgi:hypothetical protein